MLAEQGGVVLSDTSPCSAVVRIASNGVPCTAGAFDAIHAVRRTLYVQPFCMTVLRSDRLLGRSTVWIIKLAALQDWLHGILLALASLSRMPSRGRGCAAQSTSSVVPRAIVIQHTRCIACTFQRHATSAPHAGNGLWAWHWAVRMCTRNGGNARGPHITSHISLRRSCPMAEATSTPGATASVSYTQRSSNVLRPSSESVRPSVSVTPKKCASALPPRLILSVETCVAKER